MAGWRRGGAEGGGGEIWNLSCGKVVGVGGAEREGASCSSEAAVVSAWVSWFKLMHCISVYLMSFGTAQLVVARI